MLEPHGRSPDVEDAGGRVGDGGGDGAAVGTVAGGVIEHVEVGGGRQKPPLRGRRRSRRRFPLAVSFLVDDEPLGVAGERVEAELEGAGGPSGDGGHSSASQEDEEVVGGGRRRGQADEAARHERGGSAVTGV